MKLDQIREAFNSHAQAWDEYTATPMGRLREELTFRYLGQHLPDATRQTPRALDAGGGTGGLAIRLARRGFRVDLLDFAPAMLDAARDRARAAETDGITYHAAASEEAGKLFDPASFDLITCHTLIEYLPNPVAVLKLLVGLLKPRGIFSLQYVNRHADPLRLALAKSDLGAARAALDAETSCADLFGVPRRTFDQEQASAMFRAVDLQPVAKYGVRIYADYLGDKRWQTDEATYEELLQLEEATAAREPFRAIARYGLIIGERKSRPRMESASPNIGSNRQVLYV